MGISLLTKKSTLKKLLTGPLEPIELKAVGGVNDLQMIDVKPLQHNAFSPIYETEDGKVIVDKELHP